MSTAADPAPGSVLSGFRIEALIARGGMGVVYRATDLALGREVALKLIAPELSSQEPFRARFMREARIAGSLGHPNILPVYQVDEADGELFLAMQLVHGPSLAEVLGSETRLESARSAHIVMQLGEALDTAHGAGLVHRDVKPGNVLLAGPSHAYLCDFGLSRRASGSSLTTDGAFLGTAAYASPEQIRGGALDARSDVYALGCLLYECLTGTRPFERDHELALMWAHLNERPPEPGVFDRSLGRFDDVCMRALAKEPGDRFLSAGDLGRAALAAAAGGRAHLIERSVATGEAAPVATRWSRRRLFPGRTARGFGAVSAAALLIAIGAFAIGAYLRGDNPPDNPAGRIVGTPVSVPYDPDHVAAGQGRVWALAANGNHLVRLDTESEKVDTFSAGVDLGGGHYTGVDVGPDAVWIAHGVPDVGGIDHVDPATGEAVQHVTLSRAAAVDANESDVWAVAPGAKNRPGKLVRIDPGGDRVSGPTTRVGHDPADVAIGDGAVWVANRGDDSVWRIDPQTRAVKAKIAVGDQPAALAVTDSGVWVANLGNRTLMRIDPSSNRVLGAPVSLGKVIEDLVASRAALWVSAADGTITRLDSSTGDVVGDPLAPASPPFALAADGGDIWVGSASDRTLTHIEEGSG